MDLVLAAQAVAKQKRASDGTFVAAEMRDTDELPLTALAGAPLPEATPKKVKPMVLKQLGQALLDVMDTPKKTQPGVSRTVASVCKSAGLSRKKKAVGICPAIAKAPYRGLGSFGGRPRGSYKVSDSALKTILHGHASESCRPSLRCKGTAQHTLKASVRSICSKHSFGLAYRTINKRLRRGR
jgi:hypothetical protein